MGAPNSLRLVGDDVIDEKTGVTLFKATPALTPARRMELQERELLSSAGQFRVPRHTDPYDQER